MQINAIDFYKADHRSQYPRGTTKVYSNFTPRSNKFASTEEVVVFGIQGFIIKQRVGCSTGGLPQESIGYSAYPSVSANRAKRKKPLEL